jgi:cytochrome c
MAFRMKLPATSCLAAGLALFSILALPSAADGDRGKDLFERRCSGCHSLDQDKEGPRLRGVYGRTSGTVPGFQYSDALQSAHITWDAATLDRWLADPEKLVPDNDMAFRLEKADERTEIVDYLKTQRPDTEVKKALTPFHTICTPMQTRRNDASLAMTVIAVAPNIRANRSANP